MLNKGKVLALDYGSKRIGVAVSDPSRQLCFIRPFWPNPQNEQELLKLVADFCEGEAIKLVVVGIPYFADGSESEQTQVNRKFFEVLKAHLEIPVKTFDESYSSFEADQLLEEAKLKGETNKDLRDSFSAFVILRKFLRIN